MIAAALGIRAATLSGPAFIVAPAAARLAHRVQPAPLRRAFGAVPLRVAARMARNAA